MLCVEWVLCAHTTEDRVLSAEGVLCRITMSCYSASFSTNNQCQNHELYGDQYVQVHDDVVSM